MYVKHKTLTVLKTVLKHFCLEKLSYDEYRLNLYFDKVYSYILNIVLIYILLYSYVCS